MPKNSKKDLSRFKPTTYKAEVWRYFDKDFLTEEVRCKICGIILRMINSSTCTMRFHV